MLRLPNPQTQSFSSSGRLPSWRRSLPWLERPAFGARDRPHFPSRAPGKVRSGASFPISDFPNPQGGGPSTESTSPSLASPGEKSELSEITSHQRRGSTLGRKMPYLFGGMVATQAHVLGNFRTLHLRSEEQLVYFLVRQAEEISNGARSLGIELPQAKRPAFARLDLTSQHKLVLPRPN